MPINGAVRYEACLREYESGAYESALSKFSELALDLSLCEGEKAAGQIEHCMQMAIASYKEIEPMAVSKIEEKYQSDIYEQFFQVMRHYMDYTEIRDSETVNEELNREIPLGSAEERWFSMEEGVVGQESGRIGMFQFEVITAQGPRDEMEDVHLCEEIELHQKRGRPIKAQCFAIFDGHGGANCANYVKAELPKIFREETQRKSFNTELDIYNALRRICVRLNSNWKELPFQKTEMKDYSGTTAIMALILGTDLYIANVGDSRAVLVKGNDPLQLSEDAKQTVKKYQREIFLRGGEISFGRVVGEVSSLDMARSIGDIDQPSVSALPTIKKVNLGTLNKQQENYLILACDGLWDVISPQITAEVCSESSSLREIVERLEKTAYGRGSTDNVTIIAVKLVTNR